jgi:hypothetical protein
MPISIPFADTAITASAGGYRLMQRQQFPEDKGRCEAHPIRASRTPPAMARAFSEMVWQYAISPPSNPAEPEVFNFKC